VRKAEQLAGHDLVEAVEAGDAVAERGDGADLVDLDLRVVVRDLLAKKLRNFVCFDLSHLRSFSSAVHRSITAYQKRVSVQSPPGRTPELKLF
jgi:hypothetical protein